MKPMIIKGPEVQKIATIFPMQHIPVSAKHYPYFRRFLLTFSLLSCLVSSSHGQFMKKLIGGTEDLINKGRDEINNAVDKSRTTKINTFIFNNDQEKASEELAEYAEKFGNSSNFHFLCFRFNTKFFPASRIKLDTAVYHLKQAYQLEREYELCEKIGFCKNGLEPKRDSLEYNIYTLIRNDDAELTWFLNKYKQSKWQKEAFAYQTNQRFTETKKTNTINAYEQFVRKNPKASEVKEALTLQGNLAFLVAYKANSIPDYQSFLNRYPYALKDLHIKAKNKIRMIEFQNIQDQLISIQEKYRDLITNFTSSDRGGYSVSINLTNNPIELSSIEISQGNLKFRAYEAYRDVFKSIDSFNRNYPLAYESTLLNWHKNAIIESSREVDFILFSKIGGSNFYDEDNLDAAKYWEWYVQFHPKSIYYGVAKSKFNRISEIARKKQEEEQKRLDQIRENERMIAEETERKKKEELSEDFSPMTQGLKLLSASDRAYYDKVINMNSDPNGKLGNACAIGIGQCEWCGRSIRYQKTLESRIRVLQMMSNPLMGGFANIMLGLANVLGQAFGGQKTNLPLKLKNEIVNELRQIRGGKIYYCSGTSPKYCSPKCESDQKFNKRYGR